MKKQLLIQTILYLFFATFAYGQSDDAKKVDESKVAESYDRSGMTPILLDFTNDRFADYIRNSAQRISIPIKFDDNSLGVKSISAPYYRDENLSAYSNLSAFKPQVKQKLLDERLNYKLLEFWWGIQADGSYIADNIQERGMYNATDIDVNKADASKVGRAKLGDAGEKLIGNSYILVYEFREIKTMKEIYDAKDAAARKKAKKNETEFKPIKRSENGFEGEILAYLYRLSYNDTIQAYFFDSFTDENLIDLEKLYTVYNNVAEPIKFVSTTSASIEGTQKNNNPLQKTKQQLFDKFVADGISSVISSFGRNLEQFRVKTPVVSERPIKAKIGKKEGLTPDKRFFVWEYYENSKGETKTRKKAVVRSKKVHDNTNDALGYTGTTNFFQVSGGKVRNGMILQEKVDLGIGVGMGVFNYAGSSAFLMRGELNLSQLMGAFVNTSLTSFRAYAEMSFQKHDTMTHVQERNEYKFTYMRGGLSKDFYFARRFHIGLLAGVGLEQATWKDTDDTEDVDNSGHYSTFLSSMGAKIGVNLFGSMELVLTATQNTTFGDILEYNSEGELSNTHIDINWNDTGFFPDRHGLGVDVALRILF